MPSARLCQPQHYQEQTTGGKLLILQGYLHNQHHYHHDYHHHDDHDHHHNYDQQLWEGVQPWHLGKVQHGKQPGDEYQENMKEILEGDGIVFNKIYEGDKVNIANISGECQSIYEGD